jgi:hypothetical protein
MNLKLRTLVVAIAMAAAGTAQAAVINTDDYAGGNGLSLGTGAGDLFLSIYDAARSQSLTLNLNLTANDFRTNNAALMNTFSVQDALLQSFIAGSADSSQLIWNMGGISNSGLGPDTGLFTTNGVGTFSAGATINPGVQGPIDGNALTVAMGYIEAYAQANSSYFSATSPNSAISAAGSASGFNSTLWGTTFGTAINFNNSATGLGSDQLVSFIALGATDVSDLGGVPVSTTYGGKFHIDGATGTVSYLGVSAVPVPAAVWLLGSGLVGLVGISRRKQV